MSDRAVAEKTGRTWAEWIAVLDARGCATMSHKEIVAAVASEGIGAWWQQSVTVGYERARGLRETHQSSRGFGASASRTVKAPLTALWGAWADERIREGWLPGTYVVRGTTPEKSLRITWSDGSDVQVMFTEKAADRSQVAVDHRGLASGAEVPATKAYWKARLDALQAIVEGR